MRRCLDHADLGEFLEKRGMTYPNLSRQFIATYDARFRGEDFKELHFRCNGELYRLTAAQVRSALGITRRPTQRWAKAVTMQHLYDFSLLQLGIHSGRVKNIIAGSLIRSSTYSAE